MSSERRHRGAHPADQDLFAPRMIPTLRAATGDMSWLLSHRYAHGSSLKLVGDRHQLASRQRLAVGRAACSDAGRTGRAQRRLTPEQLSGRDVIIDGFNLLVSLEAALSKGVLILCRDGCIRDLSGVHGSYHAVAETDTALQEVAKRLNELQIRSATWLLDKPVSNSGRLARRIRETALAHRWPWNAEVVMNPDAELAGSSGAVITSDGRVIERAGAWFNLAADMLVGCQWCDPWLVDLGE